MRGLAFLVIFAIATEHAVSLHLSSNNIYKLNNVNPDFLQRVLEPELNGTLECIRYSMETGLPEIGLPSLVSIEIPDFNIILEDLLDLDGYSGYFHVKGGVFEGLTTIYASDLNMSLSLNPVGFSLDITLVFSNFYLELDYDMDMVTDGIPVYGDGKVIIDWTDLSLQVQFYMGISPELYISDLNIYILVGDSKITITGWFYDEEHSQVVTDLVNDYLIPHWINAQSVEISETISPILELVLNLLFTLTGGGEIDSEGLSEILQAFSENCAAQTRGLPLFLK